MRYPADGDEDAIQNFPYPAMLIIGSTTSGVCSIKEWDVASSLYDMQAYD